MDDTISRQAAIELIERMKPYHQEADDIAEMIANMPSAQPEIVLCKNCKFYTPMNRETKTGICRLLMHQNFGDDWYCAGAERRTDG